MQSCRFTISRRKRPAEPLQHGAHGTGWGAAATAAHVPQLRWQFRGRVLNNAECPKSSCHTRNYCLTREGVRRSQGKLQWQQHEMKMRKVRKKKKVQALQLSLSHTHHTHTHPSIYTHLHTLILDSLMFILKAKSQSQFLFLILLLNLRSGHFWIFFYNFYTHIFVVISGMITITITIV